jgi:serine protease Do
MQDLPNNCNNYFCEEIPRNCHRPHSCGLTMRQSRLYFVGGFDCGTRAAAGGPALVKSDAVTLMSVLYMPRGRLACWLLAVVLSSAVWAVGVPSSTNTFTRPPVPLPVHVDLKEVPAAFRKPAPESLDDLRDIQEHVAALVARVSPAVVEVEVGNASGSGVVISEDGLVLTAGHVGEWAGRRVTFTFPNGRTARGKTLGVDEDADTGLMRITDPGPWPHASVGEMNHARLGDWTLALGHPGGFDLKRSLVVRLGRIVRLMPGVVQTDCTIFPGDSGGPLFDMYGRVIAIHTAIASSTVENFHVPITEFFDTWDELTAPPPKPPPVRAQAYCGLSVVDDADGCRLSKIEKNSPAAKADLKSGDLVLKVDGRRIVASAMFQQWIAESGPGETLQLEIKRGQTVFLAQMKLQPQPRGPK